MRHFDALGLVIGGVIATALGSRSLAAQTPPPAPPKTRVQQPTTVIPKTVPLIVLGVGDSRVFWSSSNHCSASAPPEFTAHIHTNRSSGNVTYNWEVQVPAANPGFPNQSNSITVSDTLTKVSMRYVPRYIQPGVVIQVSVRLHVTTPNDVSSPWLQASFC